LLLVEEQAGSVQVHLDFFDAKHLGHGFVVENYFVLARTVEVANLRILNTLNVVRIAANRASVALA